MHQLHFLPFMAAMLTAVPASAARSTPVEAEAVVQFWVDAGPTRWFAKDQDFDRLFRERFEKDYVLAARGALGEWEQTPTGALALILLLDQYPRNSFRGTAKMYATDGAARAAADRAIAAGHDRQIGPALRRFVYLPFGHSESMIDQERSVALARTVGEDDVRHAEHHRDIIRRFDRFPHRNQILGRSMRPDEQKYLDEGGYQG